jgi:uncharacterized protein (DUF169 family)
MANYSALERTLSSALDLTRRPVAIAFRGAPPAGIKKLDGTQPSGCSFWKLAADGKTFYTLPDDHHNCPIGSYTHNIPLPPERERELTQTLGLMTELGYLRMAEVPGIPRVAETPGVIVYAPLAETPVDPDAVIVAGHPASLMLLFESAVRAGVALQPLFGRPTCMAIPAAMPQGIASSFGCIGNRVYTDLSSGELYSVISGRDLQKITDELSGIVSANATLRQYHEGRIAMLRT